MTDLAAFVDGLPEAELHLHLEGTLEQELKFEQDFYDLAMAYFRTASAQHVVYAEVFFDLRPTPAAESALATLERSLPHRDKIIGVGLDSDERDNPPVKFREVFVRARAEGYRLTMHCDVDQADSVTHIWQCRRPPGGRAQDHARPVAAGHCRPGPLPDRRRRLPHAGALARLPAWPQPAPGIADTSEADVKQVT